MSCLRFSTTIASACRDSQPGLTKIWLANFEDLVSYTLNAAGTAITGMTFSGATGTNKAFYEVALNKQVGAVMDTPTINIQNGVAVSKPKISGFVQGMESDVMAMYKQLLQATVVGVVKTIDGKYYAVGFDNGLDMISGSYGTEANVDSRKGLTFELEGIESKPTVEITGLAFETTYCV